MKRVLLLVIFAYAISMSGFSQLRFGVKGGISANPTDFYNNVTSGDAVSVLSNPMGYHFGAFARVSLPIVGLYVQPEFVYSSSATEFYTSFNDIFKQRVNQFDIPVLVGFKIAMLRVNAGPTFQISLGDKIVNETGNNSIVSELKDKCVGFQAGLGIDLFDHLTVDLRYQGDFSSSSDIFTINSTNTFEGDLNKKSILISVGYMF